MELKQFTHRELKAINNGNPPVDKLSGFDGGKLGLDPMSFFGATPLSKPKNQYNPYGNSFNRSASTLATQSSINTNGGKLLNPMGSNSSSGPTQSDAMAASIHPGFAIGAWLGGGVLEGINQQKSADELLADAGTSTDNVNGISYTRQNAVDAGKIMADYKKSTATDFLTNPGRAIAKLFGSSKQRQEAFDAQTKSFIRANGALDRAYAQWLALDSAKRNGAVEDQMLFAANGKLPKYKEGLVNGEANAKVSSGEFIAREVIPGQFVGYRVPGPKNNKDGRLAHLEPEDYVISNKNGSSDIAASGDIVGAINHMIATGNPSYKCGKLPGYAEGWIGNFIPSLMGTLAGLDQTLSAYRNTPYKPNTYAANPYETEGLSTLAGLRVNPYPIMNLLRSAESRTNRIIDIAGGLSGSQRTAARLANLNTTQKNIANMLSSIQQLNNAYRANYAQAAINAGQASRQARMSANQWDLDYYSKAHAARNRGIQTGIANMLAQIQQYQANEFKRRQFNETMDLYRDDMNQRKKNFEWMANQSTRGIGADPATNNLTSPLQGYTPSTNLLFNLQQWDRDMKKKYSFLTYNPYRRF